jgi:RNA polymerase sigma-70 factor (ECF subfamily)
LRPVSDDDALLEAARAGDKRAVEDLLARNAERIYRFGMRMCRNEEDARDVTQETMLAAAQSLADYRGDGSVSTWLYTIARRSCGRMRRLRSGEPSSVESLGSPADETHMAGAERALDEDLEAQRIDSWIRAALEDLDPGQREVFVLRDMEGLTANEVGAALQISVPAVKSRLHRARAEIRRRLEPVLGAADRKSACPDVVQHLSESLEGDLDAGACQRLEAHVDLCSSCRVRCDGLRKVLASCSRADPRTPLPADLELAVRARIRAALAQSA